MSWRPDLGRPEVTKVEELKRENAHLRRELERARERIRELERLVEELRRAGKRQAAPFSKGKPKQDPKTPGRKPGEEYGLRGKRRRPRQADETHEAPLPPRCPWCGSPDLEEERVEDQYQEDIPPVRPLVRRFGIHVGRCRACGRRVQGRHKDQTSDAVGAAAVQVGPRALALGAQMQKEMGVPWKKVAEIYRLGFGLEVNASTLCRAAHRVAEKAEPTYDGLKVALGHCEVLGPDETGWRVAAVLWWLWVWVSEEFTFYAILPGRGWDEAISVVGPEYAGTLVRDGWAPYRGYKEAEHQSCLAHLISRCKELEEGPNGTAGALASSVRRTLQKGIRLRDRWEEGEVSFHGLQVARGRLEAGLDGLLEQEKGCRQSDKRKLVKHLRREQPHLFTFLRDPTVPATNWWAEQAVRPAVVNRKVCGGNRTPKGAHTQEVLATIFRTCRQQGRESHRLLVDLMRKPGPHLLPLIPTGPRPPT